MKLSRKQMSRLKTAINKFNTLVDKEQAKLEKAGLDSLLPEKMTVQEATELMETQQDYNRLLKRLQLASPALLGQYEEAGTEEDRFQISKYNRVTAEQAVKGVNKQRHEMREQLDVKPGDYPLEAAIEDIILPDIKVDFSKYTRKGIKRFLKYVQKEDTDKRRRQQDNQYKQNYFAALDRALGSLGEPVKEILSNVSGGQMWAAVALGEEHTIGYIYRLMDVVEKVNRLFAAWDHYKVLKKIPVVLSKDG